MGGGSRSTHQHHSVDTGLGTPGARIEPTGISAAEVVSDAGPQDPGPIEHLRATAFEEIRHLAYLPDNAHANTGVIEVVFRAGQIARYGGFPRDSWTYLQQTVGRRGLADQLMTMGVLTSEPLSRPDLADSWYQLGDDRGELEIHRCPRCGRFTGRTGHDCPVDYIPNHTYAGDYGTLDAPDLAQMQHTCEFSDQPVLVPIEGRYADPNTGNYGTVDGEVAVYAPGTDLDGNTTDSSLSCTCGLTNCTHTRLATAEVNDRIHASPAITPQRRATAAVLAALGVDHAAAHEAQARGRATWPEPEVSYLDDPAAFQTAYDEALRRQQNGEDPVPLLIRDATGGLGARDGGRGFGIELEFDLEHLPYEQQAAARRAIARDLDAAGLAEDAYIWDYHEDREEGYSDARNAWRMENDLTVSGEIVSPILYDTPQAWEDLQTVCAIIRAHGGQASARAGGHVHVSAGNYDHVVDNHTRLVRLTQSYSDTLFRLASNPVRGYHRGTEWCAPTTAPSGGYQSITAARQDNRSHELALNLESMHGRSSDHAEFRMWDASLDPGVIQTQVKLSLGLTEAAFRGSPNAPVDGRLDPLGGHYERFGRRGRLRSAEDWRASTHSFRALVDTIFHRRVDKAQAASLFAVTRWTR